MAKKKSTTFKIKKKTCTRSLHANSMYCVDNTQQNMCMCRVASQTGMQMPGIFMLSCSSKESLKDLIKYRADIPPLIDFTRPVGTHIKGVHHRSLDLKKSRISFTPHCAAKTLLPLSGRKTFRGCTSSE